MRAALSEDPQTSVRTVIKAANGRLDACPNVPSFNGGNFAWPYPECHSLIITRLIK